MKLIDRLGSISQGKRYDTRKQHIESMEALAKQGEGSMEIRTSEMSDEDVQYFINEGFLVRLYHQKKDYSYYKIIWDPVEVDEYHKKNNYGKISMMLQIVKLKLQLWKNKWEGNE